MPEGSDHVLVPGQTCWRVDRADQFGCIIDGADYLLHAKAAMLRARHRIVLIGWDFDTRITFERGDKSLPGPNQLGAFLYWMLWKRPKLDVYVLKSNLRLIPAFDDIWYGVTPVAFLNRLSSRRMHLAVDGAHPLGAVHHQKVIVVDDAFALCGGIDLALDRWDTREHKENDERRRSLGREYGPRHEVATAVDGAAADALAELARDRWETATKQSLAPVEATHVVWPRGLEPILRDVDVAVSRTLPELAQRNEVREIEALNLAAIAAARHTIYLENQYLASRKLAEALAARLQEEDGPEIVIVLPRSSESRLEEESMDSARHRLLQVLWSADDHGRLGVYWPVTDGGTPIYVHSKILVADDTLLRVGSSNLNNRSMGFDSECDVAIEAQAEAQGREEIRRVIADVRKDLVCEHLGVPTEGFDRAMADGLSFLQAVETLRGEGKTLRRFSGSTVADEAGPLAENDFMDPDHVPSSLSRSVQKFIEGLTTRP